MNSTAAVAGPTDSEVRFNGGVGTINRARAVLLELNV